jgi:hypothetical protein
MTRNNWRDFILRCPVCRHRLLHLSFCARRHDVTRCRCVACHAWRYGFHAAAVESDRREFLQRRGFSVEEIDALTRVSERAA